MSRRRITRRHRRTHMNSLPTLKELIQREIADFCATLGGRLANRKHRKQYSASYHNASITFLIFFLNQ